MDMLTSGLWKALNEYLPLKQGLRLISKKQKNQKNILNEYLPLKQGLRLSLP
ncbi:hypothetical protein HMPREF9303_1355 [Prevotella denticola CRIS 18C-A]|uniref:Uncharacterized protein n=1 Tax=Prevotella denticola CRIS 18C-A TaxID=944557 RepID=F0H7E0_9BACT|nr:hypothetical protein HMPREF9303_1355 [Prevotella denticola CRIS 18C-A]